MFKSICAFVITTVVVGCASRDSGDKPAPSPSGVGIAVQPNSEARIVFVPEAAGRTDRARPFECLFGYDSNGVRHSAHIVAKNADEFYSKVRTELQKWAAVEHAHKVIIDLRVWPGETVYLRLKEIAESCGPVPVTVVRISGPMLSGPMPK